MCATVPRRGRLPKLLWADLLLLLLLHAKLVSVFMCNNFISPGNGITQPNNAGTVHSGRLTWC